MALGTSVARYFTHSEITSRQLPSAKDIRWLAGQISALPPFVSGSAVLCGSVAWGTHSPRSDIDVAHFGTTKHPQIELEIENVVARYQERTQGHFIAPKVDVVTIGIEPEAQAAKTSSHSITDEPVAPAGASIGGVFILNREFPAVFADTFVRFVDHIGSLSHVKAGRWEEFLKSYLSPQREDYRTIQREAIRSYVTTTTTAWEEQPLHRLNLGADHELTQRQLDLAGQAENYSVNLMRRILGEMALYPRPDRAADVRRRFEELTEPWAKRLVADSEPFFALGLQYDAIIADARKGNGGLTAVDYHERFSALFESLPFASIQDAVWEYLDHA
jgi:hypothetical protein